MKHLIPDVRAALKGLGPLTHNFSGKTVLLTGARGYLGRYVVAALVEMNNELSAPCQIIAMDSLVHGADDRADWRNYSEHLTFVQHDVRHDLGNSPLIVGAKRIDFVLHMAGIASPHWYQQLPLETIAVAVDGSRNMLEVAMHHGARYLFTSSSEVYQTATQVPTPESYIGAIPSLSPRSCYDISKLLGETIAFTYAEKHGVDATVVRVFNSYGPGLKEADKRILPRIASAIKAKRPITVYGSTHRLPRRTYTPVANTLLGLFLVLLKGEKVKSPDRGIYNIGLDSPELSVPELCERICTVTGHDLRWSVQAAPAHYESEPLRRCPNIDRLKSLGFRPVVDLDEGLRRFFAWSNEVYTGEV